MTRLLTICDVGFNEVVGSHEQMAREAVEWENDLFCTDPPSNVRSRESRHKSEHDVFKRADLVHMV